MADDLISDDGAVIPCSPGHVLVQFLPHIGRKHFGLHNATIEPGGYWYLPQEQAEESPLFRIVPDEEADGLPRRDGRIVSRSRITHDPVTEKTAEDYLAAPLAPQGAVPADEDDEDDESEVSE